MSIETIKVPMYRGHNGRFRKISASEKMEYAYRRVLGHIVGMFLAAAVVLLVVTLFIFLLYERA